MYGFPALNKLKPLIGQDLVQVACTSNQVILDFSEDSSIVCETDFVLSGAEGISSAISIPLANTSLIKLLDSSIVELDTEVPSTLTVAFSSRVKLILSDDAQYESFKITVQGQEYTV